jgi:hypothetical protein
MSVPDDGDYSEFRSDQIAVVIVRARPGSIRQSIFFARRWMRGSIPGSSPGTRMTWRGLQEVSNVELLEVLLRDYCKNPLTDGIRSEAGYRLWAVVPAKRARLNRARASRDSVIHSRRECPNRFDYWIPALPRRAKPGSLGRNDRQRCLRRRQGSQAASSNASNPLSSSIGRGGQPRMCRSTGITCSTPPTMA